MDNDTLIDLKLKVKFRLSEYLEKAKLPLDKSDPENPRTICPCCSATPRAIPWMCAPPPEMPLSKSRPEDKKPPFGG